MNAGGGGESVIGGGEGERPVRRRHGFADHDDPGDTEGPGSLEDGMPIRIVGRIGEVAVGVDQHRGG